MGAVPAETRIALTEQPLSVALLLHAGHEVHEILGLTRQFGHGIRRLAHGCLPQMHDTKHNGG